MKKTLDSVSLPILRNKMVKIHDKWQIRLPALATISIRDEKIHLVMMIIEIFL